MALSELSELTGLLSTLKGVINAMDQLLSEVQDKAKVEVNDTQAPIVLEYCHIHLSVICMYSLLNWGEEVALLTGNARIAGADLERAQIHRHRQRKASA